MQRIIRLKCPGCQAAIEATVTIEERVRLTCPACNKNFLAKVPPAPAGSVPVVRPKPAPIATRPPAPMFPGPLEQPLPFSPVVYQPVRKSKPLDLKPYFVGFGGLIGLSLMIMLGIFGWKWVANTDWSTFSLVPDSHDRLLAQLIRETESRAERSLAALDGKEADIASMRKESLRMGKEFEVMLVRGVRMKWAPRDERKKFQDRIKAIEDKYRPQLEAKLKAIRESKQPPPGTPDTKQREELEASPQWQEALVMTLAGATYLNTGLFDLPVPVNQPEQIYYEEADLVHEYLKVLTYVRYSGQCAAAAQKIDKLSDAVMQLAIRRSQLPPNAWEVVPREYVQKDAAFMMAQRALIVRINRDAQPDETLKDAVANFLDARQRILDATRGTNQVQLRDQFAQNKQKRAASNLHPPGDPFHVSGPTDRDMVAKPRGDMLPTIELPDMTVVNPNAPVVDSNPSTNSPTASYSPPSTGASNSATPNGAQPSRDTLASNSPPANNNSQSTTPPPASGGMPPSMPPGYAPRSPLSGNMPGFPRFNFPEDRGTAFNSQPPSPPYASPYASPQPSFPQPPAMAPGKSVRIKLYNCKRDMAEVAKELAKKLGSLNWSFSGQNSTGLITLDFAGDLQLVAREINFGTVEVIDKAERTILVRGGEP